MILISLMVGCESEIEMDYRSVAKQYVVTGYTCAAESRVTITQTSDMDQVLDKSKITSAVVTISDSDGVEYNLTLDESSDYVSTELLASNDGEVYSLDVVVENHNFSSTSQLMPNVEITSIDIETFYMPGDNKYIFCVINAPNTVGIENYYKYVLRHGDQEVVWGVIKKNNDDLTPLTLTLALASYDGNVVTISNDEDTVIADGDTISVELMSIDKRGYDYFQSLMLSDQTSSNPIANFTGGCLGYYTAHSSSSMSKVFVLSEILEL